MSASVSPTERDAPSDDATVKKRVRDDDDDAAEKHVRRASPPPPPLSQPPPTPLLAQFAQYAAPGSELAAVAASMPPPSSTVPLRARAAAAAASAPSPSSASSSSSSSSSPSSSASSSSFASSSSSSSAAPLSSSSSAAPSSAAVAAAAAAAGGVETMLNTAPKTKGPVGTVASLDADQRRALAAFDRNENLVFTGSAGCGKSYLLSVITERCRLRAHKFAITASTNLSALHVGGTTVHRFASLRLDTEPMAEVYKRLGLRYTAKTRAHMRAVKTVFVDEISMVSDVLLGRLDAVLRHVCRRPNEVFGGKQIVVVGDFAQLPPVRKRGERYAFQADAWTSADFTVFEMCTPHRQIADREYFEFLQRLRCNEHTDADYARLCEHVRTDCSDVRAPSLRPLRVDVARDNAARLARLAPSTARTYTASTNVLAMTRVRPNDPATYTKDIASPASLELRIGARVILTKPVRDSETLVNGSTGEVVAYAPGRRSDELLPVVQFDIGERVTLERFEWTIENELEAWTIVYRQVPLILAWSVTVHRAQGMTLARACIDLSSNVFEDNLAYTALSRLPSFDALIISKLDRRSLRADPVTVEYYRALRAAAAAVTA